MINRSDVHEFLKSAGIKPTDTVLIHTSMRSLGEVEGGCDGLIDAFKSYLADGLFIVPTHTWATVGPKNPVYDPKKSLPCIGALPTVAAFRPDGVLASPHALGNGIRQARGRIREGRGVRHVPLHRWRRME